MDAGIDSLLAVAFRTTLSTAIGIPSVAATVLFDYPSIREIAAYLNKACSAPKTAPPQATYMSCRRYDATYRAMARGECLATPFAIT
jgi:hypothetical protein